jgi:hypothetical protein
MSSSGAGSAGGPPSTPPRPPSAKRVAVAIASATPKKIARPSGPTVKPLINSVEASPKKHFLATSYHGKPSRFGMFFVDLIIVSSDGGHLSDYDVEADEQLYGMPAVFG